MDKIVLWEAHRGGGGGYEMPESCPISFEYGCMLGGIPDEDLHRLLSIGVRSFAVDYPNKFCRLTAGD